MTPIETFTITKSGASGSIQVNRYADGSIAFVASNGNRARATASNLEFRALFDLIKALA